LRRAPGGSPRIFPVKQVRPNLSTRPGHDPYQALRIPDYRLLLTGNLVSALGGQMLTLAVGWELNERTDSALALGFVGLVQLVPVLLLALVTGHIADRYNRKTVMILSQSVLVLSSLGLAYISYTQGSLVAFYACLLMRGIGGAFNGPAASTLPAQILPQEAFENAASWRNTVFQTASIAGPLIGGLVIAVFHTATSVYLLNVLTGVIFVALLLSIRGQRGVASRYDDAKIGRPTLRSLGEGVGFLRRTPLILSAISLDLFAVLFGGATTLLPVFARDVLQVGPTGLGWLQAAPSVGALLVALFMAHRPPMQRAGRTLMMVVAGFGVATMVFGVSTSFWLSFAMLFLLGGLDCVSMVIRGTLMLTRVPDEMRGRVAAIEGVFIGSSNQLGGFESGLTAQIFGPVLSVVGGGIATILVVFAIAYAWPDLRRLRTLRPSDEAVVRAGP
jgi:MFS family permease